MAGGRCQLLYEGCWVSKQARIRNANQLLTSQITYHRWAERHEAKKKTPMSTNDVRNASDLTRIRRHARVLTQWEF
ncbi:MAG: hypothetical protein ETSY2_30125 [Candidatus Entotheonella gemina]|uniref:Uncharacterized protein n=1 Tax=Candidatus Entotheonella gemina TaxID=1429439 RepID=W4M1X8_9BACT|nr:MAG: hypothetical protein ETSY2_30125 [Candidatus Entotheonella gemina]